MALAENLNLHMHFFAVIVAAAAYFFLGTLWYSPKVFGNYRVGHHDEVHLIPPGLGLYIGEFIIDLVMAYILALLIELVRIQSWEEGVLIALWVWVGFVATTQLSALFWSNKTIKSFLINSGFVLVGLLLMGAIIGIMRIYL